MKEEPYSFISNWSVNFMKHKDLASKKIKSIVKEGKGKIIFECADNKKVYLVCPFLNEKEEIAKELNKNDSITIVTLNDLENLNFLIKNWDSLRRIENLSLIFINPYSKLDTKWFIKPYLHHKICDECSLEAGLKSLFESVEPIDRQTFKN